MRPLRSGLILLLVTGVILQASPAGTAPGSNPPMTALLSAIVTWLSANFGLPAIYDHPVIERMPAEQISDIRYMTINPSHRREVVAVYDDITHRIAVSETWTGRTPADLSVLVHEMVHHLQNIADLTYECPAAREELAYVAQEQWLGFFGSSLHQAFDIDAATLKLTTACMMDQFH